MGDVLFFNLRPTRSRVLARLALFATRKGKLARRLICYWDKSLSIYLPHVPPFTTLRRSPLSHAATSIAHLFGYVSLLEAQTGAYSRVQAVLQIHTAVPFWSSHLWRLWLQKLMAHGSNSLEPETHRLTKEQSCHSHTMHYPCKLL